MDKHGAHKHEVIEKVEELGGLKPGVPDQVEDATGVRAAMVQGVASFYTLLRTTGVARVCTGLSCRMAGGDELLEDMRADGLQCEGVSCLGQCDRAPVALDASLELAVAEERGAICPHDPDLPIDLAGDDDASYQALARARELGFDEVITQVEASGLQGRGGAGFPAAFKWKAVAGEPGPTKYLVVNADEAEPATFKDREVMLRRPHRLIEGMAIAAEAVGATECFIYIRGEFKEPRRRVEAALAEADLDLPVRIVEGHGAYICGEETALLESIEGKRGMPRLRPPYPTQVGLFGRPTLIDNVETLACVPSIVRRGGAWFHGLGRTEPGSKLYCISGHVQRPGVYEFPLGVTLDELVEVAGGYVGTPRAFSPGGASSGFLPISMSDRPLDFKGLAEVGSMLGSAGVVVMNDTVDLVEASMDQQRFFADESCGQCAPCRIGCNIQLDAVRRHQRGEDGALDLVDDVAWEMKEGSICGLGVAAALPLASAIRHFPEDFGGTA